MVHVAQKEHSSEFTFMDLSHYVNVSYGNAQKFSWPARIVHGPPMSAAEMTETRSTIVEETWKV